VRKAWVGLCALFVFGLIEGVAELLHRYGTDAPLTEAEFEH
jgi:hypothetical protein